MNKGIIMLLTVCTIISISCCSDKTGELIVLKGIHTAMSNHVVDELWLVPPEGFHPAKSYNGFQNSSKTASISVRVTDEPLFRLKERFSPKNLKSNNWKLLSICPVKLNEIDSAFYVEYIDKEKKVDKYDLVIRDEQNSKSYYITSFKLAADDNLHAITMKYAVLSAYLGKKFVKEELYKLVTFDLEENTAIFTKDGKFPTESPENSLLKVTSKTFSSDLKVTGFINSEMRKYGKNNGLSIKKDQLQNAVYYTATMENEGNYYYIVVPFSKDIEVQVMQFSCNSETAGREFLEYARANIVKIKI